MPNPTLNIGLFNSNPNGPFANTFAKHANSPCSPYQYAEASRDAKKEHHAPRTSLSEKITFAAS